MNEKDVLVARPAAWNASKMKSIPHWVESRFCAKGGIYFSGLKCLFSGPAASIPGREFSYFSTGFIVLIFPDQPYTLPGVSFVR